MGHTHDDFHDGHSHDHHEHDHHHHNHGTPDHLHSHSHGEQAKEREEELKTLSTSFVQSFRAADDKTSFLRLSNIPFEMEGKDGLTLHLVDARIESNWQIGTASPAFASRELSYMPFPGEMVREREQMMFTYVSLTERKDVGLLELLQNQFPTDQH